MPVVRRKAPTFFHGRLRLLGVLSGLCAAALLAQSTRLVAADASSALKRARARLQTHYWLPTWRGPIIDRNGAVLARDVPRFAAAVAWDAITGVWADQQARDEARAAMGATAWAQLDAQARAQAIDERRGRFVEVLESLWNALSEAGEIEREQLDERLHATRGRVQRLAALVQDRQRRAHEAKVGPGGAPFRPRPIAEQVQPHVLLGEVDDAGARALRRFADAHPDLVELQYVRRRATDTPGEVVLIDTDTMPRDARRGTIEVHTDRPASMLVGSVRDEVWQEDLERRPFRDPETGEIDRGGYRLDDLVGASGIERAAEDRLRGHRGLVKTRRDTGERTREAPLEGASVQLTIDAQLQRRVEALLDPETGLTVVQPWHENEGLEPQTRLPASVVVLDIPTGEIMAMASTPGRSELSELSLADREALTPWLIRPTQVVVPPGSIVKPLVLAAAAAEGLVQPDETIVCNGHHVKGHPGVARCWVYRPQYGMSTHGPLQAREALARSCNCFFYELGERLGLEALAKWFGVLGMDSAPDIGLTPPHMRARGLRVEAAGLVPDEALRAEIRLRGEDRFEAIAQAIGQGRLGWTPLHAADAFATLARGGVRVEPTLVKGHQPDRSGPVTRILPLAAVEAALDGLEDGVTRHYGTGARIRYGPGDTEPIITVPEVRVQAKTGTAQAPPWVRDVDGNGTIEPGERVGSLDHAWYVGLVSRPEDDMPRYAVAVLVEYGGSGGRSAGPIADQVIRALVELGLLDEPEAA
ncbi:MAG: hypothetical protein MK101_04095 [Phycisphaerales bacterium]|nr:hypothetical protein [Phycisphaerales bacterium]